MGSSTASSAVRRLVHLRGLQPRAGQGERRKFLLDNPDLADEIEKKIRRSSIGRGPMPRGPAGRFEHGR